MEQQGSEKVHSSGPISWMARNSVAANLLMLLFLVGGFIIGLRMKQEVFPEVDLDIVRVSVEYPGASPEEVEQGILLSIEDQVRGLDGVKKVSGTAIEGQGVVTVEFLRGVDPNKSLQDIKNKVDSIDSFPEEAEKPQVSLLEPRRQVISLLLYGNFERRPLRNLAEKVRDDLIQLEGITLVELSGVSPLIISIEVPQKLLRSYHITLEEIAAIVRDSAVELPGGRVKTPEGDVLLRTEERRDYAREFNNIPVVVDEEGTEVLLGDIAKILESVEDTDLQAFFDGVPAVRIDIFRVGDQTPIGVAKTVLDYVDQLKSTLPEGVGVATWDDRSELFRDRIDLLMRNARIGLILVLILLALFLEPRLAFWVTLGIPVSIIGAFLFIPLTGATINMVSLFAFIVTLGIIVDDAIVMGENIFQKREKGLQHLDAAMEGAHEIAMPVIFAVCTNMAAFIPLFFVPGSTGKLFMQIPAVVVSVFLVSLVESLFILPAHLAHRFRKTLFWKVAAAPSVACNTLLKQLIHGPYVRYLRFALSHRYLTVSGAIAILILSVGVVFSGYVRFSYLPRVDSDLVKVQAILPLGVPVEKSEQVQRLLIEGARRAVRQTGEEQIVRGIFTQIGAPLGVIDPVGDSRIKGEGSHIVAAQMLLVPSDKREVSGIELAKIWRKEVGELPELESISFDATIASGAGRPVDIQLSHPEIDMLERAAEELGLILHHYNGVSDIDDGVTPGKTQLSFKVKPKARGLGITAFELARQLRSAFYGAEALRQQRGRNEVRVRVRLPEEEREQLFTVEEFILLTPEGGEIPLSEAAVIEEGRAYTDIRRADGRRVLTVTADVDEERANANEVIADIEENVLPRLRLKYPGLNYSLEGEQREQAESLDALAVGFSIAMIAIYAMLAVPFGSYLQPFIVMLSIPFGIVGAVIGHLLLGYELSIISMFGIIALSGVVINGALVFVVTANRMRGDGSVKEAVIHACTRRFRPIMLTALTTFFGLSPMIFETSMQARFLIPMAVSLGFGVLFGTVIILLIIPSLYLILEDLKRLFR